MPLTIAFQMDRLAALKPETDSSLYMAKEAASRGYAIFHYTPDKLHVLDGKVLAHAHAARFREGEIVFDLHEQGTLDLHEVDVVLMRQDPPFDMGYITGTYMLERLQPEVLVLNDPASVRNNPEKLFPLQFPQFIPPTLVTSSADDIRAFHRAHGEIVCKDLYSFGGRSVFHIGKSGDNLSAIMETLLAPGLPVIAQRFLPEVASEERRIVLLDGRIAGIFARVPAAGDIRANTRAGGKVIPAEITPRQRAAAEEIGEACRDLDIFFAGLDFIGDTLIEINITSPAGLTWLRDLYGTDMAAEFWDLVEEKL